jgi:hypothetical protein
MGFHQILVPANAKPVDAGRTTLIRVSTVAEAIAHAF